MVQASFITALMASGCFGGAPECEDSGDCYAGFVCREGACVEASDTAPIDPSVLTAAGGTFVGPAGWALDVPAGAVDEDVSVALSTASATTPLPGVEALRPILQVTPTLTLSAPATVRLTGAGCDDCVLFAAAALDGPFAPLTTSSEEGDVVVGELSEVAVVVLGRAASAPPTDAGTPPEDAGVDPTDAGDANDAGADAGAPTDDSGVAPSDAGASDAGVGPTDAGDADAGDPAVDAGGPPPFVCSAEACAPLVCEEDLQVCVECTDDAHCPGGTCQLADNLCITGCVDDDECGAQERCDFGECVFAPCAGHDECESGQVCNVATGVCEAPTAMCTSPLQCDEGQTCDTDAGLCVPLAPECVDDDDCGAGRFCDEGNCALLGECVDDDDCFNGDTCNPSTFMCEVPFACFDDFDCELGAFCDANQCTTIACGDDGACPQGLLCDELVGGFCVVTPSCGNDFDCPQGQQCDLGFGVCIDE